MDRVRSGRRLALLLALALCLTLLPTSALAGLETAVPIDEEHFPDEGFRALVKGYDTDDDGSLSEDELAAVTELSLLGVEVSDLRGIEYFSELAELNCGPHDGLTSLDVSQNAKLRGLNCANCGLRELDVSRNAALESISCAYCWLEELDVSGNAALKSLNCAGNSLTSLDVSQNAALLTLDVSYNGLEELDVGSCAALTSLVCAGNALSELDVRGNTALVTLDCAGNGIETLDVSENGELAWLDCHGNPLASLDIGSCPALVQAAEGEGSEMDGVVVYSGDGVGLTVSAETELIFDRTEAEIPIDEEHFPDGSFRAYVQDKLDADEDGKLSAAELDEVAALDLSGFDLEDLTGIGYFAALTYLRCDANRLKALDVSKNTALEELYCRDNQLETLTLGENERLKALDCSLNSLSGLDIRLCPTLCEATRGEKRVQDGITEYGTEPDGTFTAVLTCDENTVITGDLSARAPGDVNGDGAADAADAALLLRAILGGGELPENGDANADGKTDLLDVLSLIFTSVGRSAIAASGSDTGDVASGGNS